MSETKQKRRVVSFDVIGWQNIADELGVARSTVIEWASRNVDPLPVRRFVGRVVANKAALAEWVERSAQGRREPGGA